MGQTLGSNNSPLSSSAEATTSSTNSTNSRLMTSPSPLRQSLKRVYSVNLENKKRASSCSLPASPSVHKRLDEHTQSPDSPNKMSITLESVLKNFEEFAQHQWPLWAKRRGWIAESLTDTASQAPSQACDEASGSGRVVQVDKDKWVFQRHRGKKSEPLVSPVEDVLIESVDCRSTEIAKANILPTMDEIMSRTAAVGLPVVAGQRSRRSSGYASASSSPSTKRPTVPIDEDGTMGIISEPWASSLYEVTLRWMFETDPLIDEPSLITPLHSPQNIVALPSVNEALTLSDPVHQQSSASATAVRIYLHLMQRHNKMPSFIDFLPMPPTNPDGRLSYALVFQNGCLANDSLFSRETSSIDLIRQIVQFHPQLVGYEANKLAIYEKSWHPGKTSRARLRRLNDFDCPLTLAQQWSDVMQTFDNSDISASNNCAKTLVLQEIQNGDIPWEDFTVAELLSFMRVLEREEQHHENQIRERYRLLSERLQEAMRITSPSSSATDEEMNS